MCNKLTLSILCLLCPPHWGVDILFLLFLASVVTLGVRSRKSIYPIFTKFGMDVYWVNSLYGIAFGEDSSIAELLCYFCVLLSFPGILRKNI